MDAALIQIENATHGPESVGAESFSAAPNGGNQILRSEEDATPVILRDVSLRFGDHVVFDHLNLSVSKGERLVILGKSGSGKSALLKLIVGTHHPQSGSVHIFGQEITAMQEKDLNQLRRKIAVVFQYGALIGSLRVRKNLALALEELTDKSPEEIEAIVKEKLRLVGLPRTIDMMPYELSGGMQKRVAIARALVLEPELLLFDEPTSGLDPISCRTIDDLIVRLSREMHVTEIMIGHKMENALRVGTRLAILDEGRIVAQGSLADLERSRSPLVAQFLASIPPTYHA